MRKYPYNDIRVDCLAYPWIPKENSMAEYIDTIIDKCEKQTLTINELKDFLKIFNTCCYDFGAYLQACLADWDTSRYYDASYKEIAKGDKAFQIMHDICCNLLALEKSKTFYKVTKLY